MSEELEAITLESSIENILDIIKVFGKQKDGRYIITENALNAIEQALTPPTVDEVCDALSEWFKEKYKHVKEVIYRENHFVLSYDSGGFSSITDFTVMLLNEAPHLITMIGRFYESESERE